ncbi:hypothetical protein [Streptomyces sp. NBC_00211]|uniref:terpene synthase family protein n=1 Tax=Streptomyces sp. NBC_00211 TaxID=2975683 RepID=UPI0032456BDA
MVDYGICTPDSWLARINSGHVAAMMVPLADAGQPARHMGLFSDFCYWAYAWEDARDARLDLRPPAALTCHCQRLDRILDHPGPPPHESDPYCRSLWDLRRRLADLPGTEQALRVTEGMRRFIHGGHHWTRMRAAAPSPASTTTCSCAATTAPAAGWCPSTPSSAATSSRPRKRTTRSP